MVRRNCAKQFLPLQSDLVQLAAEKRGIIRDRHGKGSVSLALDEGFSLSRIFELRAAGFDLRRRFDGGQLGLDHRLRQARQTFDNDVSIFAREDQFIVGFAEIHHDPEFFEHFPASLIFFTLENS